MHLLTQSALLRALGWSLLNSLWQMALLWLVYAIFIRVFRQASAHARHGLAVFLLGVGTLWTGISFFTIFFSDAPSFPVIYTMEGIDWMGSFFRTGRRIVNEALPYCSVLYLLILCFLFIRYTKQYLYSRQLTRTGLSKAAPDLKLFTTETSRRLGIKKGVQVWLSSLVQGPVTLGFISPIILIPLATVTHLTTRQVEALILHELAHIRRQDYLLNLGIAFLEKFFFFNPFSRLLIRNIQEQREHCCDDMVLQFRCDAHTYISALLALAGGIKQNPRLVLAATGGNDQLLLHRVKRILKLRIAPEPLRARPLVFLCCTFFIAGMLLIRPVFKTEHPAATITFQPSQKETNMVAFVSLPLPAKPLIEAAPAPHKKKAQAHSVNDDAPEYDPAVIVDDVPSVEAEDQDGNLAGYASNVEVLKESHRDYSITAHTTKKVIAGQPAVPAPYVPNASFSWQKIQDSTLPGDQSVYMQLLATRQVEQAIAVMQLELQGQLKILQRSNPKEVPDLKQKQQIILEQLQLQHQYLDRQVQLQKKLERVGKKRVIVII